MVPLRSDTIRLVQNGCSFHGLRSEDPNQHLKDFLKPVDSLDLDDANRERTHLRSISTWEDLTTHFLAQFFLPGRTAKLRNDILMFQQHQGESLSEAWTRFKDLLQKVPHHASIVGFKFKFFMTMPPFILSAKLTVSSAANSAIRIPANLGKSLRTLPSMTMRAGMTQKNSSNQSRLGSTHVPQAYVEAVSLNPNTRTQSEPPKQTPFTFHERTSPYPQPQALGTTFEARVRDYMAAHTKRMERFENAIFKQREEINDRMIEMFGLLKELTANQTPEKVLIREEARHLITKNVNPTSVIRVEEEKNIVNNEAIGESIVEPSKSEE
ncbi:zinc finger, CCHC-type containing protein [Tanacetum coccineum]|uniref:Zinc finger, CCHC-type containing protein n=1 Tax=Tanacetum coccineum TaxID=301880 RepID=A0ABQ4ZIM5_9ASTR